jgi:hypothetical protein
MAVKYTTEFIAAIDPYMPHAIYEVFPGWVNHDMMGYRYTQDFSGEKIPKFWTHPWNPQSGCSKAK